MIHPRLSSAQRAAHIRELPPCFFFPFPIPTHYVPNLRSSAGRLITAYGLRIVAAILQEAPPDIYLPALNSRPLIDGM